jgi:hypothetical protein
MEPYWILNIHLTLPDGTSISGSTLIHLHECEHIVVSQLLASILQIYIMTALQLCPFQQIKLISKPFIQLIVCCLFIMDIFDGY